MRRAITLKRNDLGIQEQDWLDPNILDAILLGRLHLRSDAGAIPGVQIIAAPIEDQERPLLEEIGSSLALQRAAICVMCSESEMSDIRDITSVVRRVESRGALHDLLLKAELENIGPGLAVAPPESIYRYREGEVARLLQRALDSMRDDTYGTEACAVAASLVVSENMAESVDPKRFQETRPAAWSQEQSRIYSLDIRNNLSWISRNPHADEDMTARYLGAYGTTIERLLERIAEVS